MRESFYTMVYILNKGNLRVNCDKAPYELWYGRPTSINHFKVFVSKFYIKRGDDELEKFDSRTDEAIFLGYSPTKKVYKCYNLKLNKIVESGNVKMDDTK